MVYRVTRDFIYFEWDGDYCVIDKNYRRGNLIEVQNYDDCTSLGLVNISDLPAPVAALL